MGSKNVFKLETSLEKLSLIAVAVQFWDLPHVRNRIQNYCQKHLQGGSISNWLKVVDYVIGHVKLLMFPEKLLWEIRNYIPVMGERIYNWIEYVTQERRLDVKYAQKIYWTPLGTIDEIKIVDEYWLKETELTVHTFDDYLNKPLITIAALYARENFIRDNVDQMKEELNKLLPKEQRQEHWSEYDALAAWLVFYSSGNSFNALNFLQDYKKPHNLPAKSVFDECISNNYKFAVKYFWDKLDVNEKETFVIEAALTCLFGWCESTNCSGYLQEIEIEMLVFFLNQMSDIQIREFVSKNFLGMIQCFLSTWPYQELCVNLLNQNWDHNPKDIKKLLKLTMKYLSCTKKRIRLKNKCVYRLVFEKLLEKTSKETKEKYFINKNKTTFYNLYKDFDAVSLSFILNDSDLKEHRIKLIANLEGILKKLVVNGNYSDLNKLLGNAFSKEEKKAFKQNSNCLTTLIMSGEFKSADNHLNWLYDSESERLAAKEQVDPLNMCLNFVGKYRFDLADDFLLWRGFDTEEKRKNVKKSLDKSEDFLCDEIYKIWCSRDPTSYLARAEEKCSEMLQWFLESDDAVTEFKRTELIKSELFIVKYWKNLYYVESFVDLDKFLEFCMWTPEEIKEFKRKVKNNIIWWIDTLALKNIRMVDALLDWIFEDAQSKEQIITDYMNSPKGTLLYINIFKKYSHSKERVVKFFNSSWVELYTDINIPEVKLNLESFDETIVTEAVKSTILTLLAKKKEGEDIGLSDLPRKIYGLDDSTETSEDEYGDMFSNYDPSSYSEEED